MTFEKHLDRLPTADEIALFREAYAETYPVRPLLNKIDALQAQLPPEMQDCTIRFKECEKGHGWLTATNWVEFSCPTCERDMLRKLLEFVFENPNTNKFTRGLEDARKALREQSYKTCQHDLQQPNNTLRVTHDLRPGREYASTAECMVCGERFIHPLHPDREPA